MSKSTFNVLDPSDDEVLTAVADGTPEDAIAALDAACAVQEDWAATAPRERGEILRSVFEKITEKAEDLATLMTLEMGKVLRRKHGRGQVRRGVLPLVRRRSGSHRWPVHPEARRRRPHHCHQGAGRAVLCDHPVELPAGDGHPQDRPALLRRAAR